MLYFATHGLLPQPDASLPKPALVTSLGAGDSDALLDSSEILHLKLDTDLVVLVPATPVAQALTWIVRA